MLYGSEKSTFWLKRNLEKASEFLASVECTCGTRAVFKVEKRIEKPFCAGNCPLRFHVLVECENVHVFSLLNLACMISVEFFSTNLGVLAVSTSQ